MKRAAYWAAVVVVGALAVVFVRELDPARAVDVLATANLGWVALALVVNLALRVGTRVMRTRALLAVLPGAVPLVELARFVVGAMALGYLASPVVGSAARVFALERHGVPSDAVVAVGLWEKVVTGVTLALLSAVMLAWDAPPAAHDSLIVATLLGAGGLAVAILGSTVFRTFARDRAEPAGRAKRWLFSLGRSLATLNDAAAIARASGWSLVSELCDVAMLALVLHALDVPVDPARCVLAYVVMSFGTVLPSTPGQLGVFEATTAWALVAAGVPSEQALACGIIYHIVHTVPVLVVGLPSLLRLRRA